MFYELPVSNNKLNPISEKIYQDAIRILDIISLKQNPCQIDTSGACIAYRAGARTSKSCCIKSLTKKSCEQLGNCGCTTINIACKSFFCSVAMQSFSEKNINEIQKIRSMLRGALNLYETAFDELYFEKEETVRDYLGLTK